MFHLLKTILYFHIKRNQMKPQWNTSPWWDNGNRMEIGDNVPYVIPGRSPIKYPTIWDREREILGYNPRFLPNTITFDQKNRPVIRVGVHDVVGQHATVYYSRRWVKEVYIQTLNDEGKWIALPLHSVMSDKIPDWNDDSILSGTFQSEERVVFDASGDAYTIVRTRDHGDYLLHSWDGMGNWGIYELPDRQGFKHIAYRVERTARLHPPVIFALHYNNREEYHAILSIIAPQKKADGMLKNLKLRIIDEITPSDGPEHSGVSDQTLTMGGQTHIVFIRLPENHIGTPAYIVTYKHEDGSTVGPIFLGETESASEGGFADHHNGPAVVADRQGFLHVVLGAHGKPFIYRASTQPNYAIDWTTPTLISSQSAQETYISLVIGPDDTLHLVSRMQDSNGKSLHYMRKRHSDKSWSDFGRLVVPKPKLGLTKYSLWNQKLTIDRNGRLFLAYFYLAHKLKDQELKAYHTKWPNEELEWSEKDQMWKTNAHDPVILMSSDSGYSWKIATTTDFTSAWDWVTVNNPEWSDASGWDDVMNYSMIQTAVVKNKLYLLGRGDAGMHIWEFAPETNTWTKVATNTDLSDAKGWGDVSNYSTIQTAVVNDVLYLIARGNKGMVTWELKDKVWTRLVENDPELSDARGWKDIANYSTIQTAVARSEVYLLARAGKGLWTWKLDPDAKAWIKLAENDPKLADSNGWDDPANYSTIQTVVVRGKLYLLARGGKGMQTWRFDIESYSWIRLMKDSPQLADSNGWDDPANYSTIQTAVLNHKLYLLARGGRGMQTWVFNPDVSPAQWTRLVKDSPSLSDAEGWNDITNYTTIQAVVMLGELYLLARANAGIYTWKFHTETSSWSRLAANNPGWSDASGWDDAANYSTIQAAVVKDGLYLLARANKGMHTWKFNRTV
jgi:hypothetical protein